jgi:hypothetical protein
MKRTTWWEYLWTAEGVTIQTEDVREEQTKENAYTGRRGALGALE